MAEFILFLHDKPGNFVDISPEEIQRIIGKYSAWRQSLEDRGLLVGGQKLKDEGGKWLSRDEVHVAVVDGPYSEAKEVLGGLFIIQAGDYEEAVAISKECPHLEYGRIELRQIDPLGGDA